MMIAMYISVIVLIIVIFVMPYLLDLHNKQEGQKEEARKKQKRSNK